MAAKTKARVTTMAGTKNIEAVNLLGQTFVERDEPELDFDRADEAAAYERVRKYDCDPLLVAWYEKKTGRRSPTMSREEEGGKPGWVNFAKGHGGNLTVNVNNGDYIFIFKSEHEFTP